MAMFKTYAKWLLTEKGQVFNLGLATAATITVFGCYAVPNTICLSNYMDIIRLYKNGVTVPLSETLMKRFEKAMELCEIPDKQKYLYQPFAVYGFDVLNAGTSYSRFGSIIGLPINFSYNTISDIDTSTIKVKGESVCWELPEAIKLQESLILSENAQLFAICREIEMTRSTNLLTKTAMAVFGTMSLYAMCTLVNKRYNMHAKSRGLRYAMYSLAGVFTMANYTFFKDLNNCIAEESIDKKVRDKSTSLAEGGEEFYDKSLKRNKSFRKLMGPEGEKQFTVNGNFNYFVRTKHLPLVHRKSFFEPEDKVESSKQIVI